MNGKLKKERKGTKLKEKLMRGNVPFSHGANLIIGTEDSCYIKYRA